MITPSQIKQLFESDTLSTSAFLNFDLENLKSIIRLGRGSGFEWLKLNLPYFTESEAREILLKLMVASGSGARKDPNRVGAAGRR